ncbi:5964_t:CDS:2 [Dentiscutata erythropus]|uniref:5964_t:CDS:1 n=1 Tax=Dentiscutata erythropus TaxID=1348616 RepID=A0A9N9CR34_9GLOM|nr:5964_t:CDS:2 [Dentiscutata erythropus]
MDEAGVLKGIRRPILFLMQREGLNGNMQLTSKSVGGLSPPERDAAYSVRVAGRTALLVGGRLNFGC